jgi:hypothetical protein
MFSVWWKVLPAFVRLTAGNFDESVTTITRGEIRSYERLPAF